jgi:hypothetical protein
MVVFGGEPGLREPEPDETVIGSVDDRAGQLVDRSGIAFFAVIGFCHTPPAVNHCRLALVGRDALDQFPAPIAGRLG